MKKKIAILFLLVSTQIFAFANEKQLTATIIGSGSPKYNVERSGPSVLISYNETKILVDMGNGTQANLDKNSTKIKTIDSLLFTHHHLDHNEEFMPIFIQTLMGGNKTTIAGPTNTTTLVDSTLDIYKEDIDYRLSKSNRTIDSVKENFNAKNLSGNGSFYIDDIKVSYTEVNHTITTLAYRFDVDNQSIVVSGDLYFSDSLPILAKNADFLIIDSGGAVEEGSSVKVKKSSNEKTASAHVDLAESSLMAQIANVDNIVLTHFNFTNIDEDATSSEIRKNYTGNIYYAKDLMTISPVENQMTSNDDVQFSYPIVDTGVVSSYSDLNVISKPAEGDDFFGQDSNYIVNLPSYTDNGNGTITDNVTGLMWEQDMGNKLTFDSAFEKANNSNLGGYSDWRVPTIKELYSLIQFTGQVQGEKAIEMFIDTDYFYQALGDTKLGEREIDAQTWSSTEYVGKTMRNDRTVFGVNFVDGRIKGYPKYNRKTKSDNKMYFRMVRGNIDYGKNNFIDNGDGTISDYATGLMWQKSDDGNGRDWENSLEYAENLKLGGYDDWRLPDAKELQSIVDYSKSPQTTNSAAINSIFDTSKITDLDGNKNQYPFFWTSTTHLDGKNPYTGAVYVAFGDGQGKMNNKLMDVHGAGCQRSDPKSGNESSYPQFFGPQGDIRYVFNYVRAVRYITKPINIVINAESTNKGGEVKSQKNSSFKTRLTKMDKNSDGKISKTEAKGKLKANFDKRDKNGDNYITEDEM